MNLLALAQELLDPALRQALQRAGRWSRNDGPEDAHVVPADLEQALRYAALSPGKRLRPALVLGTAQAIGAQADDALPAACAVEFVHAYSLVHDDLPAMDNADTRRGRPSCHAKFGEAVALLVGDALLSEAFALLSDDQPMGKGRRVPPGRRVKAIHELARAVGPGGMVGGQKDDLTLASQAPTEAFLAAVHRRKTGRLIQASAALGAIVGGATEKKVRQIRAFGTELGLAFQLVDDLLDNDGMVKLLGPELVQQHAALATERALGHLAPFGKRADPLRALAHSMIRRET